MLFVSNHPNIKYKKKTFKNLLCCIVRKGASWKFIKLTLLWGGVLLPGLRTTSLYNFLFENPIWKVEFRLLITKAMHYPSKRNISKICTTEIGTSDLLHSYKNHTPGIKRILHAVLSWKLQKRQST